MLCTTAPLKLPLSQDYVVEEGAIAISRTADASFDSALVYAEIDAIAQATLRIVETWQSATESPVNASREVMSMSRLEAAYFSSLEKGSPQTDMNKTIIDTLARKQSGLLHAVDDAVLTNASSKSPSEGDPHAGPAPATPGVESMRAGNRKKCRSELSLLALNQAMFRELGYRGNRDDYYVSNPLAEFLEGRARADLCARA